MSRSLLASGADRIVTHVARHVLGTPRITTLLIAAVLMTPATAALSAQTGAPPAAPATPAASVASAPPALPPIQFKVLFDVDYASQEPELPPPRSGFGLRRARLFAQLNGPAGLGFRLHFDPSALANGPQAAAAYRAVPLTEAFLDYTLPGHIVIRAGQQRVPFTLSSITAGPVMPVPEYNQLLRYTTQQISAFRDIGVTASGRSGGLEYSGGIFNGAGINVIADNDSTRDYAGRLSYAIVPGVQLGASAWVGHTGTLFVRNVGAPPIKNFFDNADFHRNAVDLHVALGALDVAAEYGTERLEYNAKAINPIPVGGALERRGYNVQSALRLGALSTALSRVEVAGRYDVWDPNRAIAGDRITEYVAGLSFYLFQTNAPTDPRLGRSMTFIQRQSRIMTFWEWDQPESSGPAAPPSAPLKNRTQRFHARWELFY